jgi:hypothetical protein
LTFVIAKIHSTGGFAEDVIRKMIDAIMGAAVESLETMRIMHNKKYGIIEI